MIIEIPGCPIAQARPRFVRRGPFVKAYNPQETEAGKFMLLLREQWHGPSMEIPVAVQFYFYMPIPKSMLPTGKLTRPAALEAIRNGKVKHVKKPDLDNLVKFVKDCATGIIWHDDSQVWHIVASKQYSEYPRTEIVLQWEGMAESK